MAKIIMLSGLQGTGKSTIAKRLASDLKLPLFTRDAFETILFNDGLTDGTSISSYHLMLDMAQRHSSLGVGCVLDAVFPLVGFRDRVRQIAIEHQADLFVIHTYCSDESVHRHQLETRESLVPWDRITWQDVQHTLSYYEPWIENDALFLDAINPLETNVDKALQYIRKDS